jgi:hypothetical protein
MVERDGSSGALGIGKLDVLGGVCSTRVRRDAGRSRQNPQRAGKDRIRNGQVKTESATGRSRQNPQHRHCLRRCLHLLCNSRAHLHTPLHVVAVDILRRVPAHVLVLALSMTPEEPGPARLLIYSRYVVGLGTTQPVNARIRPRMRCSAARAWSREYSHTTPQRTIREMRRRYDISTLEFTWGRCWW